MAQDPAFLFYYKDILVSCADMDADVLGWYTRLLCHQADKPEGLPDDMESLALLAGVKMSQFQRFTVCWEHTLAAHFEKNDKGMLHNVKQTKELEHRRNYKNKQEKRGIVGQFIKKMREFHAFSNEEWKQLSYDLVQAILPISDKDQIEELLKHTLEAYAASIYGNANGNIDTTTVGEVGKEGEEEKHPTVKKEKPLYSKCVDLYFDFFKRQHDGIPPKFEKKHGEAMKSIITYLTGVVKAKAKNQNLSPPELEGAVAESFELILNQWDTLSEFTRSHVDLCAMSSQFNRIISEIKTKRNGSHKQTPSGTAKAGRSDINEQARATY